MEKPVVSKNKGIDMEKKYFGVMLDMSRNAVMKPETVKQFVDYISSFGYNMLQLYTEDTYEVNNEPYFGYLRGGYKKQEIKEKFESQKADALQKISENGKYLKNSIEKTKELILNLESEIQALKEKKIESMREQNRLDSELKDLAAKGAEYESDK